MATIDDVARHAGVGLGTVSRVLNGSPKVAEGTRQRVLASMASLEYRPNPQARALSLGRGHLIGAVVPFFTHDSAVERLRGVAAELEESPYDLVLCNVASPAHTDQPFLLLSGAHRADGLLVISLPVPAHDLERLARARIPVVLVDAHHDGVANVVTDDVAGGRIATEHLVALGHRAISFVGEDPDNSFGFTATSKRHRGYEETLRRHRIRHRPELVRHGPHDRDVAATLARDLLALPERPTAIFASSDVQALGVVAAATAAGLRVPEDLSVIGFDDIPLAAYAGLTTVRQPLFESGRRGARMLLDALGTGAPPTSDTDELPLELVVRATTAPPPRRPRGAT